jgi:hypothetical protein
MTRCPQGHEVADDANFCDVCGAVVNFVPAELTTQPIATRVIETEPVTTQQIPVEPLAADAVTTAHAATSADSVTTEIFSSGPPRERFAWAKDHPMTTAAIAIVAFVLALILIAALFPRKRTTVAIASPPAPAVTPFATPSVTPAPTIETPLPSGAAGAAAAPTPEAVAAAPTMETPSSGQPSAPDPRMEIAESGVLAKRAKSGDNTDTFSSAVLVRNPANQTATDVKVDVNFKDSSGRIVKSDSRSIGSVGPGQANYVAFSGTVDNGSADPVVVEATAKAGGFANRSVQQWPITDLTYESNATASKVKGTYRNPDGAVSTLTIMCAVYSGGRIVSGASDVENNVNAGASKGFEAFGALPNLNPTSIRCSTDTN